MYEREAETLINEILTYMCFFVFVFPFLVYLVIAFETFDLLVNIYYNTLLSDTFKYMFFFARFFRCGRFSLLIYARQCILSLSRVSAIQDVGYDELLYLSVMLSLKPL